MNDLVSVVITSKNEEKNIFNILNSLAIQTYKNIELILVDNFSEDNTIEISKKFKIKIINHGKERSEQRNIGLNISRGKYGLYLDADMILTPNLISSLVSEIKEKNCEGIYIKEFVIGESFFNITRNFEREFYEGSSIDAIRFFKLDKFKEIGGFDENITGQEDWDFSIRFNEKYNSKLLKKEINEELMLKNNNFYKQLIKRNKISFEGILHNEIDFKLDDHIKKKKYYLKTFEYYKKKYKNHYSFKQQFTMLGRLNIFFKSKNVVKIVARPHIFFLMLFLKLFVFFKAGFNKI